MTKRSLPPYDAACAKRPSVAASESISNLDRSNTGTDAAAQIECDVSPIEHQASSPVLQDSELNWAGANFYEEH